MKIRRIKYGTFYNSYLAFLAIVMIALPKSIGVLIVPLALIAIYGGIKKKLQFNLNIVSILFILFYLAYLIGAIYTDNAQIATKYLEYKLSFIIFPVLFLFKPKNEKLNISIIIIQVVIGSVLVALYGIVNSFICASNGGENCFVTVIISPIHHPTYLMSMMTFAMASSWLGVRMKWEYFKMSWVIPFSFLVIAFHYYTMSLAAMLFLLLFVGFTVIFSIYKLFGKIISLLSVLFVFGAIYFAIYFVPRLEGEWNSAKWYLDEYNKDPKGFVESRDSTMSGSEQRLVMWTVSYDQMKEHPFGVGTGNVDDVLGKKLVQLNQSNLAKRELNPHNQFLQTGVEIGIFGLLILVAIIIYSALYAIRRRNWLLLFLSFNLAFNSLFESMLQRQSGIVFFTFWMCLLILIDFNKPKIEQ